MDELKQKEYRKYYSNENKCEEHIDLLKKPKLNAEESLMRIRDLEIIRETGDLELLNNLMPLKEQCVNDTIRDALENMKKKSLIEDYKVYTNGGRGKLGLPKHKNLLDEIYLYEGNGTEPITFDESESLKPQITAIEKNVPWTYIYFVPPKSCKDVDEVFKEVFNQTTQAVGNSLRKRYCELFGE